MQIARHTKTHRLDNMTIRLINELIQAELAAVPDDRRRTSLEKHLVEPRLEKWNWAYGNEVFEVWVVAQSFDGEISLVYSPSGFGPSCPWGIVHTRSKDLGTDGAWHVSLDHAFINSLWTGPRPDNYEVP